MSKIWTRIIALLSALLLAISFAGASPASASPVNGAAFDTYVNIDCYWFGTGDEGIAYNGVGFNYGSGNFKVDIYFKIDGPFALEASSIYKNTSLYTGSGTWGTPTYYNITGTNDGTWQIEMKVYSSSGLLATAYDSTSCG